LLLTFYRDICIHVLFTKDYTALLVSRCVSIWNIVKHELKMAIITEATDIKMN